MSKQILEVGKWYKFSPYKDRPNERWYMKYSGGHYMASEFITDKKNYKEKTASFSDYSYNGSDICYTYQLALPKEVNQYLPADKQIQVELPIFN